MNEWGKGWGRRRKSGWWDPRALISRMCRERHVAKDTRRWWRSHTLSAPLTHIHTHTHTQRYAISYLSIHPIRSHCVILQCHVFPSRCCSGNWYRNSLFSSFFLQILIIYFACALLISFSSACLLLLLLAGQRPFNNHIFLCFFVWINKELLLLEKVFG